MVIFPSHFDSPKNASRIRLGTLATVDEIRIHGLRGHGSDRGGFGYCNDASAMAAVDPFDMAPLDSLVARASSALAAETPSSQPPDQDDDP
jgi:hypothetical protein